MTNLKDKLHERVFVPTSVEKELPKESGRYGVFLKDFDCIDSEVFSMADSWIIGNSYEVVEWLKPSPEPSYLLTPLELLELRKKWASEDWDAAENRTNYDKYQFEGWETIPADKETYINSLNL